MSIVWAQLVLFGVALAAGAQAPAVPHAMVQVTVLDANELPVPDALVEAYPQGVELAAALTRCSTDASGHCALALGQAGEYAILASKEQDGYPKQYPFYRGLHAAPLPIVHVSAEHASEAVVAHVGKRAGVLVGTVRDAVTGKPLNANVEFRWVHEPTNFWSGSGLTNASFRILAPADAPITMVVSLEGYESWHYALGHGELKNAIVLKPGEELTLEIRLWPRR
jgi:hypothetical protein